MYLNDDFMMFLFDEYLQETKSDEEIPVQLEKFFQAFDNHELEAKYYHIPIRLVRDFLEQAQLDLNEEMVLSDDFYDDYDDFDDDEFTYDFDEYEDEDDDYDIEELLDELDIDPDSIKADILRGYEIDDPHARLDYAKQLHAQVLKEEGEVSEIDLTSLKFEVVFAYENLGKISPQQSYLLDILELGSDEESSAKNRLLANYVYLEDRDNALHVINAYYPEPNMMTLFSMALLEYKLDNLNESIGYLKTLEEIHPDFFDDVNEILNYPEYYEEDETIELIEIDDLLMIHNKSLVNCPEFFEWMIAQ